MKKGVSAVFACAGAVIGAGFASGREIVSFFTQYGGHSWWLILLASGVIVWLSALCMQSCGGKKQQEFPGSKRILTLAASCGLMVITAGAMIAVGGQLIALLCVEKYAYALGSVMTVWTAWKASRAGMRFLGWLSALLSILFVGTLLYALSWAPEEGAVLNCALSFSEILNAAVFSASYAAMNMMLAVGVVCRCDGGKWVPLGIGALIGTLLCLSNAVYIRQPETAGAGLPLIALLNRCGRKGFLAGLVLMYLSVFTTLTAVLTGLQAAFASRIKSRPVCGALTVGLPIAVSCAGFSGIVDGLYAPAGLYCLLMVFLPLQMKHTRSGT